VALAGPEGGSHGGNCSWMSAMCVELADGDVGTPISSMGAVVWLPCRHLEQGGLQGGRKHRGTQSRLAKVLGVPRRALAWKRCWEHHETAAGDAGGREGQEKGLGLPMELTANGYDRPRNTQTGN